MERLLRGIWVVVLLASCGGDDAGPGPGDDVIGRWMEALTPNQDPERLDSITYNADRTYVFGVGGTANVGDWRVEGDRLFITMNNAWSSRWDYQFAVDDGRLLTDVLRPDGDGAWFGIAHGRAPTDAWEERVYRLRLDPAGTGTYSVENSNGPHMYEGTWREDGHFLFFDTPERTYDFVVAPDAIGHGFLERLGDV